MGIGVIVICVIVAGMLLTWGVRGRYVGRAWCRACRSDLPNPAETGRCLHCGADLETDLAVGVGRRVKRPVTIGLAALFAWVGLSIAAARLIEWLNTVDWQAYKPAGALVSEANSDDAGEAMAAINELLRRHESRSLPESRRDELVDLLLAKVMPTPWTTALPWVPLVEQAWLDGRLRDEQTLDFVKHLTSLSCGLSSRNDLRQGTFLRFGLAPSSRRGRLTGNSLVVSTLPLGVSLAGEPVRAEFKTPSRVILINPSSTVGSDSVLIPIVASPGVHSLQSTWQIDVQVSGMPETALTWTETVAQYITVLPPDLESAEILVDEQASQALRQSAQIDLVGVCGFHPETGADVIVGVVDLAPAAMQVRADFQVWLGAEWVQFVERRSTLLVCAPLEDGEHEAPLRIVIHATPIEFIDMPGRTRDTRPVWYGPDITIECPPVEWFESIRDERIPETIRKRLWDRMIVQLGPRPVAKDDP